MEQAELIEDGEFSSFQELSKSIKKWEEANFVTFYTRSSIGLLLNEEKGARARASLGARPFTDSCPPGRKGLVTHAHTFGDFPHDSWGTVLPRVLLIGSCGFFTLP